MTAPRLPLHDPRTIARDIPGVLDGIFPQLLPGVVAHFNRQAQSDPSATAIDDALVNTSALPKAMLFELSATAAEQLVLGNEIDWIVALFKAGARQRRHFDAKVPESLTEADRYVAGAVAQNIAAMLATLGQDYSSSVLSVAPRICGLEWIHSGNGDFAIGPALIEVKCTSRRFSSADFRQLLMYWLLSYAAAIEQRQVEWKVGVLLNPRLNLILSLPFDELIAVVAAGRSKLELLQLFIATVGSRTDWFR